MRLTRTMGALVGALALGVSLVACGGGGGGSDAPDLGSLRDDLVGTWELASAESDEESWDEGTVDAMADAGMLVTIDLDDDGDLIYNEVGNQQEGSWSVEDDGSLTFDLDGTTIEVPFEDDTLTLEASGMTMVFDKASDEPNMDRQPEDNAGDVSVDPTEDPVETDDPVDTSDPNSFAYLFSDEMVFMQQMIYAGATQTTPLDVTIADDPTALIQITGLAEDIEGDTGYLVHVENRSDVDFMVTNYTTTLDGQDVWDYATLSCTVRAGESADGFFYFDHDVVSVSEGSSVEATFVTLDIEQNPLGLYNMSL